MSRIKRHVARRDKARALMDLLEHADEDKRPLDAEKTLVAIMQDIPAKAIQPTSKDSPYEWQTIHIVMQCASLVEAISEDALPVKNYYPLNLQYFRARWTQLRRNKSATMQDYKKLLTNHSSLV